MTRSLTAIGVLLLLAPLVCAQDMPLSQILIDGEGWKKVESKHEKPQSNLLVRVGIEGGKQRMWAPVEGRDITIAEGRDLTDLGPHSLTLSREGATAFLGYPSRKAVWAFQVSKDGVLTDGAPYCPLRLPKGHPYMEVLSIAIDREGRIYAATEIGVQVFDPTGRMCGVLTPAAPGKPESMSFEGDHLTMWIGNSKYSRKLNATGTK